MFCQFDQFAGGDAVFFIRMVRMGARPSNRRWETARRSRANPPSRLTRVEIVTMRPMPADSARGDDGVEIFGEIGKVEMAVAIDQHGVRTAQSTLGST